MRTTTPDAEVRALARRQHGVFALGQVLGLGFTRPLVRRRLERTVWEEVLSRVYRSAASRPVDWRQSQMAAVLATGGAASGVGAGALYGLVPPPSVPEVILRRSPRRRLAATVRTSGDLPATDLTVVDGIAATTPARTLVDLGGQLPRRLFEDVLDTAIVNGLVTVDRLRTRAEELRTPRRAGCTVVLELLAARSPELSRAANVWEARVLRIVHDLGLPPPRVNHRVHVGGRRRYLDLAWPHAKVAVEFDGFVPHSTRRVFDDDRARQNDLVADGWTVFRVTKTMLDGDVRRTFAPIAAAVTAQNHALWNASVPKRV